MLWSSADLFFYKSSLKTMFSVKQFARHFVRPDLFAKGYQQTTLVDKELK